MSYLIILFSVMLVLGLVAIASNPSPYFAALALVVVAWVSCGLLTILTGGFLALVLFLIYLGGMLVVFAYSSALAADNYPEAWLSVGAGHVVYLYMLATILVGAIYWQDAGGVRGKKKTQCMLFDRGDSCFSSLGWDAEGVAMLYDFGGGILTLTGWVLLLTLFVVLELVRGLARGTIRLV